MSDTYHFPPDLLDLLCDTIPKLTRTKKGVVDFFKGAGVTPNITNDLVRKLNKDKASISKYEIARTILVRLNERGDQTLKERREVLKRVTEFENFSACWENDRLQAKGLVAEICKIVNVRDSFTRINQERELERQARLKEKKAKQEAERKRKEELLAVKSNLFALFSEKDAHKRGKTLEVVLNRLFMLDGILLKEAFTIKGNEGQGIIEQIDGVIEIDGQIYLVEMKWWEKPLGPGEVSQHLVRVFSRSQVGGIFISNSGYTPAAENNFREALQQKVVVMCNLEEFVYVLEKEVELKKFMKAKINAAITHKNPFYEPLKHEFI
jgi:restriction system protein